MLKSKVHFYIARNRFYLRFSNHFVECAKYKHSYRVIFPVQYLTNLEISCIILCSSCDCVRYHLTTIYLQQRLKPQSACMCDLRFRSRGDITWFAWALWPAWANSYRSVCHALSWPVESSRRATAQILIIMRLNIWPSGSERLLTENTLLHSTIDTHMLVIDSQ